MALAPVASKSPWGTALTLRPLRGHMRTSPPRRSFNVAGAISGDNSDPEATLMPEPANWTDVRPLASEANNSPIGTGPWAAARSESSVSAAQPARVALLLKIAESQKDRPGYSSLTKSYLS